MRKCLIITALLLGIGLGGLCGAHASVSGAETAVAIQETVVLGDRNALDGLELTDVIQAGAGRLLWTTRCGFTGELRTETEFSYQRLGANWPYEWERRGITISMCSAGFSVGGGGRTGIDLKEEIGERELMWEPVLDVAARAPAGQIYTEQVNLRDYYAYYPLYVTWDWNSSWWDSEVQDRLSGQITSFFRIPVADEVLAEVSIEKDEQGRVWGASLNALEEVGWLECYSIPVEGGSLFALAARRMQTIDQEGNTVSVPMEILLPDGSAAAAGLWYLEAPAQEQPDAVGNPGLVCPLGTGEVRAMARSCDESRLMVVLREDSADWLCVIDLATLELVQKLPLFTVERTDTDLQGVAQLHVRPGFLVARGHDGSFVLLEEQEDGTCAERVRDTMDPVEAWECALFSGQEPVMAWDGERLALAARRERHGNHCAFVLAVYDGGGLRCAAEYTHSLDQSSREDWQMMCRPADNEEQGLSLSWGA